MPYAILRFAKRKAGGVTANYAHNERRKESYKSNPDIDRERTKDNYHFVKPVQNYRREVKRLIEASGCRTRSNSTFMAEKIGQENIISAVVHMDEKTPHMHPSFCPITRDKRLSAKAILGNQAQLSKWQTQFHEYMSERWSVLERGISSMETKRKHVPVWLFKSAERLDKQFEGVTTALANINALNAGKKRDNALSLLAEWLPEAEKFTAQLNHVNRHIQCLEQDVEIKEKNTQYWKSEANENKEKVVDYVIEIRRLQLQIAKQKRLLDSIPQEMKQELKEKRERGAGQ